MIVTAHSLQHHLTTTLEADLLVPRRQELTFRSDPGVCIDPQAGRKVSKRVQDRVLEMRPSGSQRGVYGQQSSQRWSQTAVALRDK